MLRGGGSLTTEEAKSDEWSKEIKKLSEPGQISLFLIAGAVMFVICYGAMITALTGSMPIYFATTKNCVASRYATGQPFPISTAPFYLNRGFTNIGPQNFWYTGEYGWDFMPARGICPVDAIWVVENENGVVTWEGWYAAYRERVDVIRRKLGSEEATTASTNVAVDAWENAPEGSFRELYSSAKMGVELTYHSLKDMAAGTYDAFSGARAKRVANGGDPDVEPLPSHHRLAVHGHRALYSTSSDDDGPTYDFKCVVLSVCFI